MAIEVNEETFCKDCVFPMKDSAPRFRIAGGSDNPFPLNFIKPDPGDRTFPLQISADLLARSRFGFADQIKSVDLCPVEGVPLTHILTAVGQFAGSGWVNGTLIQRTYVVEPEDGIYDFDFTAANAASPNFALTFVVAISEITAPSNFKGVRVHSKNNEIEALA